MAEVIKIPIVAIIVLTNIFLASLAYHLGYTNGIMEKVKIYGRGQVD